MPPLINYLADLPCLELSATGRRNVCTRFGLSEVELSAALTRVSTRRQKGGHL
jgi:hypothetical protein